MSDGSPRSTAILKHRSTSEVHQTGSSLGVPNLKISSVCSPCNPSSQLITLGVPKSATGSITTSVPVSANQVIWPALQLHLLAYNPFSSDSTSWSFLRVVRCDHLYPTAWRYPGCVIASFVPTVDLSGLPTISRNIAAVQAQGNHVGQPGVYPLHRNSGPDESENNRKLSCPKFLKRPPGYSCDEYPFASTSEGGGRMPPIDRYVGYVPVAENNLQGTILAAFYRDQRIIRAFSIGGYGDAFYVLA